MYNFMELDAVKGQRGEERETRTYYNCNIKEYLAHNYRKATKKLVIKNNK